MVHILFSDNHEHEFNCDNIKFQGTIIQLIFKLNYHFENNWEA